MTPETTVNSQKLRVAFTKGAQPATFKAPNATANATTSATPPLKALAHRVLERNRQRNQCATKAEKQRNFDPKKHPQKLRPVARVAPPQNKEPVAYVYEYRLTDSPGTWLVMIAPKQLENPLSELQRVFGARVLDIRRWEKKSCAG